MRAKVSLDIESMIDDIGSAKLTEQILFYYPDALKVFIGHRSPDELGDLLRATMSPEALAELREALK